MGTTPLAASVPRRRLASWPTPDEPIKAALAKLARDWPTLPADLQAVALAMIQALVAFIGAR